MKVTTRHRPLMENGHAVHPTKKCPKCGSRRYGKFKFGNGLNRTNKYYCYSCYEVTEETAQKKVTGPSVRLPFETFTLSELLAWVKQARPTQVTMTKRQAKIYLRVVNQHVYEAPLRFMGVSFTVV